MSHKGDWDRTNPKKFSEGYEKIRWPKKPKESKPDAPKPESVGKIYGQLDT